MRTDRSSPDMLKIGTIGGNETFAGQSTDKMRRMYPFLGEPHFFASGADLFEALRERHVDAVIGAAGNLAGDTEMVHMLLNPDSGLYVVAEAALPFGCHLLGASDATLAQVTVVHGGPASIAQAQSFLSAHLPNAVTNIYSDPLATGRSVAAGDGSEAVLGTRQLARRFGLSILAEQVDGGIVNGNWWALGNVRFFAEAPTRLVVTARWSEAEKLATMLQELASVGFALTTITGRATGRTLFETDYLLRFHGSGSLHDIEAIIAATAGARLAGAMPAPTGGA